MHLLVQDTKISSLERNIRDLEDEVQMLKTTGLLHPDERQDELKQVEVYKSHSKFMKTKVETLCMSHQPASCCMIWVMHVTSWVHEHLFIIHISLIYGYFRLLLSCCLTMFMMYWKSCFMWELMWRNETQYVKPLCFVMYGVCIVYPVYIIR